MEVKVLCCEACTAVGSCWVGEARGGWNHQEGEGLPAGGSQRLFLTISDMIGIDALDCVQQLGILLDTC